MFDFATTSILPSLTEIGCVAEGHIFQRLCEEAERYLNYTTFRHLLFAVPLVGKQSVYDSKPFSLSALIAFSRVAMISSSLLPAIGWLNIAFFILL